MSNADYLNGLAAWVRSERERLSIAGDLLSCDDLSARFMTEAGKSVSGETLRRWESGKGKRRIDEDKEQAIAAYCRATNQPIPDWLQPAIKPIEEVDLAQLLEFINQATPDDAAKISAIVTEGIRWLVAHGYGPKPRPQSIEAFRAELLTHTQAIAVATEMPPERIQAIAQGDSLTRVEAAKLTAYWGTDGAWLTDMLSDSIDGSASAPTTDRRAKSKQHRPPSGKA
jgi:hypothetical protein